MAKNVSNDMPSYLNGMRFTTESLRRMAEVEKKGAKTVVDIVTAPFDFLGWLIKNKEIAIIGAIALVILILKD